MKTKPLVGADAQVAHFAHQNLSLRTLPHFGIAAAASVSLPLTARRATGSPEPVAAAGAAWNELAGEFDVLREPIFLISGANNPSPRPVAGSFSRPSRVCFAPGDTHESEVF